MSKTSHASLSATGNALEEQFKTLAGRPDAPEFKTLVDTLHDWLTQCVDHGRFLPPGSADRRSLQAQVDYWTSRLQQAGHVFDEIDRLAPFDPQAGHVLADDLFPYHGLQAANGGANKVFAGRDEQVKEYSDHIDRHPALLIQSESGGGKSSVAMAGVLPELRQRHPDWRVLDRVTPGTQPADTLREALGGLLSLSSVDAPAVQAALAGQTVLVYVDQLEELLTMCTSEAQQREFSDLLADLAEAGVLRLVATLRVDHYERLAHSAACLRLYALLTRDGSVKTLPPMSLAQIRQVILKPAEAVGLRFVPASIVDALASETASAPSGLPLLQFALQRLWDERPRLDGRPDGPRLDMITAESFAKLPTVSTALGRVADLYFDEMQAQGLVKACRRLMLELTVIDERLEVPLRRRRAEAEVLATLVNAGLAKPEQAQTLVEGLVERRLLVRSGEGDGRQIEVAHEALFRYWGQFQDWINKDEVRATLRTARHITRDALLWQRSDDSPDLLNLRGQTLKDALDIRRGHWLEPLAAAYVDACHEAVAADERHKEHTAKALKSAETERQRAEAERERAQAAAHERRRWLFVVIGLGAAVTLGSMAVIKLLYDGQQVLKVSQSALVSKQQANIMSVAFVLPQVRPMEALDLAFTIRETLKSPESLATLAHAIDDTGPAISVGDRRNGPAFFTPSGLATAQLVGGPRGLDHALVRALGLGLTALSDPIKVPLNLQPGEDLASIDVGPRISDGGHLVVTSFIGPPGPQGRSMTRLQIHRADGSTRAVQPLAEIPFPSNLQPARNASLVAFDSSGRQLAIAARLLVPAGLRGDVVASQLIRWGIDQAPQVESGASSDADAATALAFHDGTEPVLIKGRLDGRIDCGRRGFMESADWRRVLQLKTNGNGHYAALHDDNSITLGDCGDLRSAKQVQPPGPAKPEQLMLRRNARGDSLMLTYTVQGRLVCQRFRDGAAEQAVNEARCLGDGLFADSAVPATHADGRLAGYRVLDREAPLMMFWDLGRGTGAPAEETEHGLPVVGTEQDAFARKVAESPNGQHRIAIERLESKPAEVFRLGADGAVGKAFVDIKSPARTAVNDQGVAVVLASRKAKDRHLLTSISPGDQVLSSVKTFDDAACMKLSPDGQQVVVASDRWAAKRMTLDGKPLDVAQSYRGVDAVLDNPVVGCAIGNGPGATVVLATREGQVIRFAPETGTWTPMSELVTFALGGPALDVSIDADSRFVAVVSSRRPSRCRNGADGHLLRIWDLKLARSDYPVASTCLANDLQAIGPIAKNAQGDWVLPLYHQVRYREGVRQRKIDFTCQACGDTATTERIKRMAADLGAAPLPPDRVAKKYGIELD